MNGLHFNKLAKSKSILTLLWTLIIIIASLNIQGQDIAGEIDFNKSPVNNEENPGSAALFTDADFKLFPNPAGNLVQIHSKVQLKEGVILTLSDIQGNVLEKRVLGSSLTKNDYSFDLSRYSGGQYIISILSIEGSFVTKKLIKRG